MPIFEVDGAGMHYREDGQADTPVLVLSNSLGTDLTMWEPQVADFSRRFRVVRYDTRGHGASAVTPGPYTIEQLGRDALGLLDGLGISRAHFCGLSMGGMIGMWLAVHAPERLDRLVLCNTAALLGPREMWDARIAAVESGGMAAIAPAGLARWFTEPALRRPHAMVEAMRRVLLATSPEGYSACCAAIRDMDQRDAIAAVRAPTLVITGTRDVATPPADGQFLAQRIPGAHYVELDAAHLSNIEAADQFSDAVLSFLER